MADSNKSGRVYGGMSPSERESARRKNLLDAAIDTLIAGEKLTVRGLCARAGLTSRYFYENFRSTDELAETAYDTCVADIAETVAAAFATPQELSDQIDRAMTALVESLEKDPRAGHILFSYRIDNPLISRKRQESTAFFASITAATAGAAVDSAVDVGHAAHFVVGGVTQLLSVWLNSEPGPATDSGSDTGSGAAAGTATDTGGLRPAGGGAATGPGRPRATFPGQPPATIPAAPSDLDGPAVARLASTMIKALATQLASGLTPPSSSSTAAASPPGPGT